ncbi:MAG: carboxypeptidase M32 [Actinomycetota bacterium]|nr:carboxypeptidase M32 [Actinomycetota bacterium]
MSKTESKNDWDRFAVRMRELHDLAHIGGVLGWDQQTMMPPKGAAARGRAMGTLAGVRHERVVDPELGSLIASLEGSDLDAEKKAMVKRMRRGFDLETKLPARLVQERAETASAAHVTWEEARRKDDFEIFAPHLEKTFELLAEQAEYLGYDKEPYDAHLDLFEMGMKTSDVEPVFDEVAKQVRPLLSRVLETSTQDWELPATPDHLDALLSYSRDLVSRIGFDMQGGRLDLTAHPFCSGTDPGDVRLTTRLDANNPKECVLATVHEAGHGMYQQGIPTEWMGTAIGSYISLAVHESQSRLWENHVARSRAFWQGEAPRASAAIAPWKGLGADDFYKGTNRVRPDSYIRVEADELTYPLHVILRFEIEIAVSRGDLKARDLPGVWNESMHKHLGITPPNDAKGVLQDVHWSSGLFGYFPTYLLGSIYSAGLFNKATVDLGGQSKVDSAFVAGDFSALLGWLRDKIHSKGALYDPMELINLALDRPANSPIDTTAYTDYLRDKFTALYG